MQTNVKMDNPFLNGLLLTKYCWLVDDKLTDYVRTYSKKIEKNGKVYYKSPKIQRLLTPIKEKRRRKRFADRKAQRVQVNAAKKCDLHV